MTPTLTVFANSPDRGRGLARDMRVRWAFDEVGQPYEVATISFAALKQPPHLALHPFGQIPAYQEGELTLFESGAIVLHIAQHHPGLLPDAPAPRARATAWIFAALSTVEPPIVELEQAGYAERTEPWHQSRLPLLHARIRQRLDDLARHLGTNDWLESTFSAGDLMMVMVLRRLEGTQLLADYPALAAYIARGEARPAYQRAYAAQRALFEAG
ncbi:glutathione S-transferase family protein [Frigidibacter sp.]|uniref:glutathione S-transferase family protein n=1 Tax=Frigidibacter sp. TaxID=2586418 RepID=UPI00273302A5|nr:glutathione S-transferase family protein [Frigidibacter sp.]MDP3340103.1 glutathione S-transferase family protein [Frigidibacter sp.]